MTIYRKKLIEVALPLEAINAASAREKSIRHGHPSTLHMWWARRPLASARAVIFSQMADDPSEYADELLSDPPTRAAAEKELRAQFKVWEARKQLFDKAAAARMRPSANPDPGPAPTLQGIAANLERQRLFELIEKLVLWENTTNETVLESARAEIRRSWRRTCLDNAAHPQAADLFDPEKLPAFHDPFAGGGSLPLEAQRLGLEAYASDLNPVAVLINKAMIEIPPKFAGLPPVNPEARAEQRLLPEEWKGARGLAEDLRYYGKWMRDQAEKRIGHLYPRVEIMPEMAQERPDLKPYVGQKLTVIAWLWARTVKSPNPAFAHVDVPLATNFMLHTKPGKEVYIEPIFQNNDYYFTVKIGKPKDVEAAKNGTKLARGANFRCIMSNTPIAPDYIKAEGKAGRMGMRLMAIVADGKQERIYLPSANSIDAVTPQEYHGWKPDIKLSEDKRAFWTPPYGIITYGDLFTPRQLITLTALSDLVQEAHDQVQRDALSAGLRSDKISTASHGSGADAYAVAVKLYLALIVSKQTAFLVTLSRWRSGEGKSAPAFGRQALPMVWDFVDINPFAGAGGDFLGIVDGVEKTLHNSPPPIAGIAEQADATVQAFSSGCIVSTDPPYYDNIGYADLSDYFYVWLRYLLKDDYPNLFATLAVPKTEELVATPYRHGSKAKAEAFFLEGMTRAMCRLAEQVHPAFPVTIYYAFKQTESNESGETASTGWDTFLEAVIRAGFSISGTWPIRTESQTRLIGMLTNALASSIVLVCRKHPSNAPNITRRDFVSALKTELPAAFVELQRGNIAPVDLAQAAIGPGMAVFTRYEKVLDAQGQPLTVRQALALINETLDEVLAEQEGDFDADSRWALAWFEQLGFTEGEFGVAETLSKAKDTSVEGLAAAGILTAGRGKVRLLKPIELPADWDPTTDKRLTTWEMVHQLVRALESGGESAGAELLAKLGPQAETARELCYRLYTICERKKRAAEALSYNGLVQSWPEVSRLAREISQRRPTQAQLL